MYKICCFLVWPPGRKTVYSNTHKYIVISESDSLMKGFTSRFIRCHYK